MPKTRIELTFVTFWLNLSKIWSPIASIVAVSGSPFLRASIPDLALQISAFETKCRILELDYELSHVGVPIQLWFKEKAKNQTVAYFFLFIGWSLSISVGGSWLLVSFLTFVLGLNPLPSCRVLPTEPLSRKSKSTKTEGWIICFELWHQRLAFWQCDFTYYTKLATLFIAIFSLIYRH